MVAINSLALVAVLFGLPETKWNRASETEHTQPVRSVPSTEKGSEQTRGIKSKGLDTSSGEQHSSAQPNQQASVHGIGKPALYQFRFFQPTLDPIQSLLYSFFLPLRLFCYPIVQFASFIVSFSSACYLIVTFVQAEALGVPPYKFDSLTIGFTNFASLVGAFIGLATAGPASDWISAQLTRRNNGVREPEMRLLTIVPYAAVMLLGTFVVGFGLQYEWDWRVSDAPSSSPTVDPLFFDQKLYLPVYLTLNCPGYHRRWFWLCRHPGCCPTSNCSDICNRQLQARCRLHFRIHHDQQKCMGLWRFTICHAVDTAGGLCGSRYVKRSTSFPVVLLWGVVLGLR